ncbi:arsenite methyltransferase [Salarchaeum japonicum]|uniref:Arsenite methyltransferase n=1 Tax=Salarchaeum japonicum TaxID=555573 RepID=A0AAV3SYM4_9EURY|nr:arsenite methyltransferase [Salarchaeum japonicum]
MGSIDDRRERPDSLDADRQRRAVRERYAAIADDTDACCGTDEAAVERARQAGYDDADATGDASDANLGLGCGNPDAIAALSSGETVLDLGSGAGFDCFLAADRVGPAGRVVGVDMTPEMVERAREKAASDDYENVEFRLGEIEHLPVADATIDAVISNCVINLSPDKPRVFAEAYRALRPGGRLAVSDVVLTADVPPELRADPDAVAACVAGASTIDRLRALLADAGFADVEITPVDDGAEMLSEWAADHDPSDFLVSASIAARKPA